MESKSELFIDGAAFNASFKAMPIFRVTQMCFAEKLGLLQTRNTVVSSHFLIFFLRKHFYLPIVNM